MAKDTGGNGTQNQEPMISIPISLAKGVSDYIQQVPSGSFSTGVALQLIGQIQMEMAKAGYLLNGPGQPVTKGKQPDLTVVEPEIEAPKEQ